MSDKKITQLTELVSPDTDDVLPIVDVSANETKKVKVSNLGGGSGTPASPDTSIQFNDGGSFGGDADLTWDKTLKSLGIVGGILIADDQVLNQFGITVQQSQVADTPGTTIFVDAGKGNGTGAGGGFLIDAGAGGDSGGTGGAFALGGGIGGANGGVGGALTLHGGTGTTEFGSGGDVLIKGGDTNGATANGGDVLIRGGEPNTSGTGGDVVIKGGSTVSADTPGKIEVRLGGNSLGDSGTLEIIKPSGIGGFLDFDSLSSSDKTFTFPNQSGTIATVTSGVGAPGTTPVAVGQIYCDTSGGKVYISTGTTNSGDWKILN